MQHANKERPLSDSSEESQQELEEQQLSTMAGGGYKPDEWQPGDWGGEPNPYPS